MSGPEILHDMENQFWAVGCGLGWTMGNGTLGILNMYLNLDKGRNGKLNQSRNSLE